MYKKIREFFASKEETDPGAQDSLKQRLKEIRRIMRGELLEILKPLQDGESSLSLPDQYQTIEKGRDFLSKQVTHLTKWAENDSRLLDQMASDIAERHFRSIENVPEEVLKTRVHQVEEDGLRKALVAKYRAMKEEKIVDAMRKRLVSWGATLIRSDGVGHNVDERIVEFPLAVELGDFPSPGKILDAGSAMNIRYVKEFIGQPKAHMVHYTQSANREDNLFNEDLVSYHFGDLRNIDFKDGTFDRILCISTIEHVGMDNSRYGGGAEQYPDSALAALREMMRVLKKGGGMFLTFPYGKSVNHGWYRVLGQEDVGQMVDHCHPSEVQEKYYHYDSCWYETDKNSPSFTLSGDGEIYGIGAVLFIK